MEKILTYDLTAKDGTLPDIPWLHDYKLSEISVDDNKIVLTSTDFENRDYDYSDFAGFRPKKVAVEFFCKDINDGVDCNVYVVRYCSKKQFRENNKFGYGAKVNCYGISEFVSFYDNYNMEFIETAVGYHKAIIKFGVEARKEIVMVFFCDSVKYVFSD